jgi:hypothetical protein
LLAAADPAGDPALIWRAANRLRIARPASKPAEDAGLLEIGTTVRFRHPLVRSAVYRTASPEKRRAVHQALAEATDAWVDPDRRAWHLAAATAGHDEDVAAELERAAERAQARGGLAAAAAFLERAMALTLEPPSRAERALPAAQTKYEAGLLEDAVALLAVAERGPLDRLQRARTRLLRAQIAFSAWRDSDAPLLLLNAARAFDAVDVNLARTTYLEAFSAALFVGQLARDRGVVQASKAALAGPPPRQPPRPPDLLLEGLATRFTEGYASGASILKDALRAFRRETVLRPQEARWLWLASWAASDLWDDETWRLLSTRHLGLVRDAGALSALPIVLTARSTLNVISGELAEAASLLEELTAVTEATGIRSLPNTALWLAALRGRKTDLAELIATAVSDAVSRGEGLALPLADFATALLFNSLGQYGRP